MADSERPLGIPSLDASTIPEQPDNFSNEEHSALWGKAQATEFRKDSAQDRSERKTYAGRIFRLLIGWLCVVASILFLRGFFKFTFFNLSDAVLMTLIGSTTASVVGIFIIVTKYLFPKRTR